MHHFTKWLVSIALAALAVTAQAQVSTPPNTETGAINFGPVSSTTPGTAIGVKDPKYGAKGDARTFADGTITSGSATFTSASATFTPNDVGKTIQIDGAAGVNTAPLVTTIAAYVSAHTVTLGANATATAPRYYLAYSTTVTSGTAGSYIPGETISITGGTSTVTAAAKVETTTVRTIARNADGAAGTTGACVLTGTTGTGVPFSANATITAGAISALGSITVAGHYLTNPTSLAAEPVTSNCGLTGATLTLTMGVDVASVGTAGNYSVLPANPVATGAGSSSGATGATLTAGWTTTGTFVYGTDDTAAFTAAINQTATQFALGQQTYVYAPAGTYLINGAALPYFNGFGGGIVGDGHGKTNIIIGASYSGDLFSWSEAWIAISRPFNGMALQATTTKAGPIVHGLTISGDRLATAQQNAMVFYDRDDLIDIDDVDVQYLNGRCLYSGVTKNTSQGFIRESRIGRLRCFNAGSASAPVMEFNTQGSGDTTNEIDITRVDIYAPYGTGFLVRSNGGSSGGIKVHQLRVEGLEYDSANVAADLLVIGDTIETGIVAGVRFEQLELTDPYLGQVAMRLTASGVATQPYGIEVVQGAIGGGLPLGAGLEVDFGRSSHFHFPLFNTWDKNVVIGASAGNSIIVDSDGAETGLTTTLGNTTSLGFPGYLLASANNSTLYTPGTGAVSIGNQTTGAALKTVNGSGLNDSPWLVKGGRVGLAAGILTGLNPRIQAIDGSQIIFNTNAGTSGSQGGQTQFQVAHTASAVDYVSCTGAATANPATVSCTATGTDTNININLVPKGVGTVIGGGTTFTITSGCATVSALSGNSSAGSFSTTTTGTCTPVIALPTVAHGWHCNADDITAGHVVHFTQTATATNSCTVSGATTSGDTIVFDAVPY